MAYPPQQAAGTIDYDALQKASEAANPDDGQTHGAAYLQSLSPQMAQLIKNYAEGKAQLPAGRMGASNPRYMALLSAIERYDPTFDVANVQKRFQTVKAYTPGGKEYDQVQALNTAVDHLGRLATAADALHNKNFQMYNAIANAISSQFGWTGVTDFNTIAPREAQEITRLWRQAGGSEEDIRRELAVYNTSMTPDQLRDSVATTAGMIHDRDKSLEEGYRAGMGLAQPMSFLRPDTRQLLQQLEQRYQRGGVQTGPRIGERRMFGTQQGEWDGKGWKPVQSVQ